MKKIALIIFLMFGTYALSIAQTTSASTKTSTSKQDKAAIAAQKKADKEAKEAAKKQAKEEKAAASAKTKADKKAEVDKMKANKTSASAHLNKNGTPDKRFKANKSPKTIAAQTPAPPAQVQATNAPSNVTKSASVAHTRTPKTADKEIGKDSKGRTLYQGPRGGKYYLTANGNKEYVK